MNTSAITISAHCFLYELKLFLQAKKKEKKFLEHLAYGIIYLWHSAVLSNFEMSSF